MYMIVEVSQYVAVASFSEAWIEMKRDLPSTQLFCVASFLEVWIEINVCFIVLFYIMVASFLEVWIEIFDLHDFRLSSKSPPSWRCGLKWWSWLSPNYGLNVASFLEVWIEIHMSYFLFPNSSCRLLLGGVDWNRLMADIIFPTASVASFSEAWIEI